ncbi:unnamed protein product [Arabis nemorensis]|uniref:Uncharacterized protein n=1 Tax=Arabis nemorensis TaxID=586526 RepID=A0A565BBW5_9BRAS|nr:unnamed protein product [Arabis nemorensis]
MLEVEMLDWWLWFLDLVSSGWAEWSYQTQRVIARLGLQSPAISTPTILGSSFESGETHYFGSVICLTQAVWLDMLLFSKFIRYLRC